MRDESCPFQPRDGPGLIDSSRDHSQMFAASAMVKPVGCFLPSLRGQR